MHEPSQIANTFIRGDKQYLFFTSLITTNITLPLSDPLPQPQQSHGRCVVSLSVVLLHKSELNDTGSYVSSSGAEWCTQDLTSFSAVPHKHNAERIIQKREGWAVFFYLLVNVHSNYTVVHHKRSTSTKRTLYFHSILMKGNAKPHSMDQMYGLDTVWSIWGCHYIKRGWRYQVSRFPCECSPFTI